MSITTAIIIALMIILGYRVAAFIFALISAACSASEASLPRMSSRVPDASPARTIFT